MLVAGGLAIVGGIVAYTAKSMTTLISANISDILSQRENSLSYSC